MLRTYLTVVFLQKRPPNWGTITFCLEKGSYFRAYKKGPGGIFCGAPYRNSYLHSLILIIMFYPPFPASQGDDYLILYSSPLILQSWKFVALDGFFFRKTQIRFFLLHLIRLLCNPFLRFIIKNVVYMWHIVLKFDSFFSYQRNQFSRVPMKCRNDFFSIL